MRPPLHTAVVTAAALLVASHISRPVLEYCAFSRSHGHPGLDLALGQFQASALLELGLSSTDGTGAVLAWPLVHAAAALLTEVAEGEHPGPTMPGTGPQDLDVQVEAHDAEAMDSAPGRHGEAQGA